MKKSLSELKNVGKATLQDLTLLDIHTVDTLAIAHPTELFHRLEKKRVSVKIPVYGISLLQLFMKQKQERLHVGGNGHHSVNIYKRMACFFMLHSVLLSS